MIAHVLLFRPRADLTGPARTQLADALDAALHGIPSLRRARVGRRVQIDRPYEQMMRANLPYAAILEFDDEAGLRAYLDHPAHEALATRFFEAVEEALIYDFDLAEEDQARKQIL